MILITLLQIIYCFCKCLLYGEQASVLNFKIIRSFPK